MRIEVTKPLFAWDCLEDSPTLKTIKKLLEVIPDEPLLESLSAARGEGRNDYPLSVLCMRFICMRLFCNVVADLRDA